MSHLDGAKDFFMAIVSVQVANWILERWKKSSKCLSIRTKLLYILPACNIEVYSLFSRTSDSLRTFHHVWNNFQAVHSIVEIVQCSTDNGVHDRQLDEQSTGQFCFHLENYCARKSFPLHFCTDSTSHCCEENEQPVVRRERSATMITIMPPSNELHGLARALFQSDYAIYFRSYRSRKRRKSGSSSKVNDTTPLIITETICKGDNHQSKFSKKQNLYVEQTV